MVDAANSETLGAAKTELHNLLDKPQLQGIPVLVLGNKRDLPNALDEKKLIEELYASSYTKYYVLTQHYMHFCYLEIYLRFRTEKYVVIRFLVKNRKT